MKTALFIGCPASQNQVPDIEYFNIISNFGSMSGGKKIQIMSLKMINI